jgi:hypothetical protein
VVSADRKTRKTFVKYVALTLSKVCRPFSPRYVHSISTPHVQIDISFKPKSFIVVCCDNLPMLCISTMARVTDIFS